jgi:DNA (cytosine-5)-methyltransferase 1
MKKSGNRAISLFSNCGAGDLGYAKAGFKFEVMAELDPRRLEVCLLNHPDAVGVPGDLRHTYKEVIETYRRRAGQGRPALMAACPPCQGLSSARGDRGHANDPDSGCKDQRNLLVTVIAQIAQSLKPQIVVVENVQAFLVRQIRHPDSRRGLSAAQLLVEKLHDAYEVFPILADLCDFGIPQTRKRAFLTFVSRDLPGLDKLIRRMKAPYPLPLFSKEYGGSAITLQEALDGFGLPSLDASEEATAKSNIGGGLHSVPVWQDRRYAMVAAIPPHTGAGAWRNDICPECSGYQTRSDNALCAYCNAPLLRPIVKARNGRLRLIHGFNSSYSRMKSDEPASTITTASGHLGSDFTIHPYENRLLSALECARLQGFPPRFKWGKALEKWGSTNVRNMIGEAVPPTFTEAHGRVLRAILKGIRLRSFICAKDPRCQRARKKLGVSTVKASNVSMAG